MARTHGIPNPAALWRIRSLLEELSIWTHRRLTAAASYNLSMREESITEHLLVDMATRSEGAIRVVSLTPRQESKDGADWDWLIGSPSQGWQRFTVQAKKLDMRRSPPTYEQIYYPHSAKPDSGTLAGDQLGKLCATARRSGAQPIYCLYNWGPGLALDTMCTIPVDEAYGCTIAPVDVIAKYHGPKTTPTFSDIHHNNHVHPWHCWLAFRARACTDGLVAANAPGPQSMPEGWSDGPEAPNIDDEYPNYYPELPKAVRERFAGREPNWPDVYGGVEFVPKFLVVVDTSAPSIEAK